ncbi:MAG: preprotein translocase subunit SecG [Candidatus Omnitrophota bacterium]
MMNFLIVIHVMVCIGLIMIVLIQRGRGSGLVEAFSGVESMFGTKTDAFLTRTTTVLSILFFATCLGLAFLSVSKSRSLMGNVRPQEETSQKEEPIAQEPAQGTQQAQAEQPVKEESKQETTPITP